MKYLKLFENFEPSDEIKETIEELFYEFTDLNVDVFKRNTSHLVGRGYNGEDYTVIITPKVLSYQTFPDHDQYRSLNYFDNKGDLNERIKQLFNYMRSEDFSLRVYYDKIISSGSFVDTPGFSNRVKQFDTVYMSPNTPIENYQNFAEDDKLVKITFNFHRDLVNEKLQSADYKYGCVMIETPFDNWSEITSIIDEQDLYNEPGDNTYGIQKNPHLTLLYGLHKEVSPEMVQNALEGFNDTKIKLNGIGIFENDEFDVVKINVDPVGSLQVMHDKLAELPHTSDYPNYEPHITIGYVKKGLGRKYLNDDYRDTKLVSDVSYSMTNGEKIYFNL